jgi:hypothetical protein
MMLWFLIVQGSGGRPGFGRGGGGFGGPGPASSME